VGSKDESPDLASRALLRALTRPKGRLTMSVQQTPPKVKGGHPTTLSSTRELLEDLARLQSLSEKQIDRIVSITARLALALDILKEHGWLEEFLAEIGEEDES